MTINSKIIFDHSLDLILLFLLLNTEFLSFFFSFFHLVFKSFFFVVFGFETIVSFIVIFETEDILILQKNMFDVFSFLRVITMNVQSLIGSMMDLLEVNLLHSELMFDMDGIAFKTVFKLHGLIY